MLEALETRVLASLTNRVLKHSIYGGGWIQWISRAWTENESGADLDWNVCEERTVDMNICVCYSA